MHAQVEGPDKGPDKGRVVMFANSLGTDLRVRDLMLPYLPEGPRIVCFDNRGHGLSDCPSPPYSIDMLLRMPAEGYAGACAALANADLTEGTRRLTLPVLALAGSQDQATTPALARATADLCDAAYLEIGGAGHLPCVERPQETAQLFTAFLEETEHARPI